MHTPPMHMWGASSKRRCSTWVWMVLRQLPLVSSRSPENAVKSESFGDRASGFGLNQSKTWYLIPVWRLVHWHVLPSVSVSFSVRSPVLFRSQAFLRGGYCYNILNQCSHSSSSWLLRDKYSNSCIPPTCSANDGICYSMGRWMSKSKNFTILTPFDGLCSNLLNMFPMGVAYSVYQLVAPPVILPTVWHCFTIAMFAGQVDILASKSHQLTPLK